MVLDKFNLGRVDYYFYTVGPDKFWIKAYYNEISRVTKYNSIRQFVNKKIKEIKRECMGNPEKKKKVIHFIDDYTPSESMEMDYIEEFLRWFHNADKILRIHVHRDKEFSTY